jgi:hypothetical protein
MEPFFFVCPTPSRAIAVCVQIFRIALWVEFTLIPKRLVILSPAARTCPRALSLHVATCATHLLQTCALDVDRTLWIEYTPPCHGRFALAPATFERLHFAWNGTEFTESYREPLPHTCFHTLLSDPGLASPR